MEETQYCELKKGSNFSCSKTKDASKNSLLCEYRPTSRRCALKKNKTMKKPKKSPSILKIKKSKIKKKTLLSISSLKCDNEEDPISITHFKDDKVPIEDIIALEMNNEKRLCFEGETIWSMFSNHVSNSFDVFSNVSKGNFNGLKPLDMSVWGISGDILKNKDVQKFLEKRAKIGIKNNEFKDPNAPYEKNLSLSARHLLENFLVDRIDPDNSIHVEYLTKAILGDHIDSGNIKSYEWKSLVEIVYGTWVSPYSNNIRYLKPLTTKARSDMTKTSDESEKRIIFIHLLINMYNEILKKSSPDEARSKITMLLWALQLQLQESY
jgi:hypothetical protein